MWGIPISIIIGLLAVLVGGWLQQRQWYRNSREEIRVRETEEATKLISEIARTIDKRIAAQRALAYHASDEDGSEFLKDYRTRFSDFSEKSFGLIVAQ